MQAQAREQADRFLDHLCAERRLSAHTVLAYRRDLAALTRFCDARDIPRWDALDVHAARAFAANLRQKGLASRSIQRHLSAARGLYRFLARERLARVNPFDGIPAPKSPRHLPKTLSPEQATLLVSVDADDPLAIRDRAVLELFYGSGLRLSELVALNVPDLRLTEAQVRVLGKGAKTREVPLGRYACDALAAWLRQRAALRCPDDALFVTRSGRRIGASPTGRVARGWTCRCIRTCCATALPAICWNPAAICARSRSCSATAT